MFLFGMKMHRQIGSIEFSDADFANTLSIHSKSFAGKSLEECCHIINHCLRDSGFAQDMMKVPTFKQIDDFELKHIRVNKKLKIQLRMNSFDDALRVYHTLNRAVLNIEDPEEGSVKARFSC